MYKISNMSWCFKYKLTLSLYRRLFSQHPVDHIDRSYTIMSMFTLRALLKNDHESFINIEFKTHNVCARNVQCRYTCNMFDDLPAYSQSVCIYQSPTTINFWSWTWNIHRNRKTFFIWSQDVNPLVRDKIEGQTFCQFCN